MEKTKKPAIRFDGFTEDWELHKVADCLVERNEQSPQSNEYPLMAFIANEGIAPKGERYDRSSLISDAENKLYKRTEFGDFIYSSNNLTSGSIGLNKYGKASISPVYSIFYPSELAESDFIGRRFVRDDFISEMIKWRQGVVYGQWRIHESDFVRIDVHIPQKAEQIIIGKFLDDVDGLIFQHQQKYDKLLTFKKSMLEKLFPQNGAKVPEVRFAGFAGEWESHPLNEIADRIVEKNIGCSITETFTNSAEYGVISQRDFFDHDISNKANLGNYYIIKDNDFVYNPRISVTAPCGPINRNKLGRTGVTSPLYTVFRTHDIDNEYLEWYFKSHYWFSFMRYNGDSGARSDRFSIKNDLFFQMPIPVPKIEEQIKIGAFLKSLDKLVSLYSAELEKLKNIKTALLEKMFV